MCVTSQCVKTSRMSKVFLIRKWISTQQKNTSARKRDRYVPSEKTSVKIKGKNWVRTLYAIFSSTTWRKRNNREKRTWSGCIYITERNSWITLTSKRGINFCYTTEKFNISITPDATFPIFKQVLCCERETHIYQVTLSQNSKSKKRKIPLIFVINFSHNILGTLSHNFS